MNDITNRVRIDVGPYLGVQIDGHFIQRPRTCSHQSLELIANKDTQWLYDGRSNFFSEKIRSVEFKALADSAFERNTHNRA